MGLGSIQSMSLAQARAERDRWQDMLNDRRASVNPIVERRRQEELARRERKSPTLEEVTPLAFDAIKGRLKDEGQAGRWMSPLNLHILPSLGQSRIEKIDQFDIERTLRPIWRSKAPTATKALQRLNVVLNHAAAMGLAVNRNATLDARRLLGEQGHRVEHHPALPWQIVPKLYQWLRPEITAQRALKLYILTGGGTRLGPLRTAKRDQFKNGLWTVPATLIKGRTAGDDDFRVPVVPVMQELVEWPTGDRGGEYLFPSPRSRPEKPRAISDQAIENVMRDREFAWAWPEPFRPHGLRSSFRTWASHVDPGLYAVAETALAHRVGGIVERTYDRNELLDRRRALMEQWAEHVTSGDTSPKSDQK